MDEIVSYFFTALVAFLFGCLGIISTHTTDLKYTTVVEFNKLCEQNGGVLNITTNTRNYNVEAQCGNGAKFIVNNK